MKKFIYRNKKLRCRVRYLKEYSQFNFRVQKKVILIWWNTWCEKTTFQHNVEDIKKESNERLDWYLECEDRDELSIEKMKELK